VQKNLLDASTIGVGFWWITSFLTCDMRHNITSIISHSYAWSSTWNSGTLLVLGICSFSGQTTLITSHNAHATRHMQKMWYVSSRSMPQSVYMSKTLKFCFFFLSHVVRELVTIFQAYTHTLEGVGHPSHYVLDFVKCPDYCACWCVMKWIPCHLVRIADGEGALFSSAHSSTSSSLLEEAW
jgi:hypothetical protein